MANYILKRVSQTLLVLFLITVFLFLILKAVPGDPARLLAGIKASPEVVEALRHKLGLDRPWPVQYKLFVFGLVTGKLKSITFSSSVISVLYERLPASVELGILSMIIALLISIPSGIISAVKPNSLIDYSVTSVSLIGISTPVFWTALLLMMLFGVKLHWLPVSGRGRTVWGWSFLTADGFRHLIIPSLALASVQMALNARLVRSSMLEVLNEEYILTARAKGLREAKVILLHAFRNALLPVMTNIGLQMGTIVSGAVLTETTTAWPGIGRLMYEAIVRRDQTLVFGLTLFIAAFNLISYLLVDIAYAYVDPRIKYD